MKLLKVKILKHKTINMAGMTELMLSGPGQETGSKFLTVSLVSKTVIWLWVQVSVSGN